jgi:putative transposase
MVQYAIKQHGLSERRACRLFEISRSLYRYQPQVKNDEPIETKLKELAEQYPRWGFQKMKDWLRNKGYSWNHKRIYRVYCQLDLNLRVKPKKRLPVRHPKPLKPPAEPHQAWSLDFMSDSLQSGQRFRTLNIIDEYNRELLWIEIDTSLPAQRVVRVLDQVAQWYGYPQRLRLDNGPELIANVLANWAEQHQLALGFIEPGCPAQNAYIERFNRTYREDVLDMYLFRTLDEVRQISEQWAYLYNAERPHDALGGLSPYDYAQANSNLLC